VAELSLQKAHYLHEQLLATGKFVSMFDKPFFKEFAVKSQIPIAELNQKLMGGSMIGGYSLERDYPELERGWLLAVTEKRTRKEMDELVRRVVMGHE
jgi:glycine dehydrogenase subunit 1